MHKYCLTSHAHACATKDHVVILDLHRDKYLAIPNVKNECLEDLIEGWPPTKDLLAASSATATTKEVLEHLLAMDLVTDRDAPQASPPAKAISRPAAPIIETVLLHTLCADVSRPPRVRIVDLANFVLAFLRARSQLRGQPIESIVVRTRARKTRKNRETEDLELVRTLVTKARLMRPFVYAAKQQCLLDSYVLVEFLARYGIFPDWIFAVQTRPFSAHCWVQSGPVTLNDTPEHASLFAPIMIV